jgi:putative ABC transport system substrate-binding protein
VFNSGGDVVHIGLVANLNRPGGNITGVNLIAGPLAAKQFEILHELIPKAKTIAFLINPENANARQDSATVQEAARLLGVRVVVVRSSDKISFEDICVTCSGESWRLARERRCILHQGARRSCRNVGSPCDSGNLPVA